MLLETDKAGGDRQRLDRAGKAAAKVAQKVRAYGEGYPVENKDNKADSPKRKLAVGRGRCF